MRMSMLPSHFRVIALMLGSMALTGCLPSSPNGADEEKEPHFLQGKNLVGAMDYTGAVECFEQALEANPKSAAAHFELALLYYQKQADPAAAIYHCQQYLKLRPAAPNSETVTQLVLNCKQELARTVSLGPVSEKQQKEMEKLADQNKQLTEENKSLKEELNKWRAYYAGRAPQPAPTIAKASAAGSETDAVRPSARASDSPSMSAMGASSVAADKNLDGSRAGVRAPVARADMVRPASASASNSQLAANTARTHSYTIKPGDTAFVIAKRNGVKLAALVDANPGLDPRRLRPGQNLSIP